MLFGILGGRWGGRGEVCKEEGFQKEQKPRKAINQDQEAHQLQVGVAWGCSRCWRRFLQLTLSCWSIIFKKKQKILELLLVQFININRLKILPSLIYINWEAIWWLYLCIVPMSRSHEDDTFVCVCEFWWWVEGLCFWLLTSASHQALITLPAGWFNDPHTWGEKVKWQKEASISCFVPGLMTLMMPLMRP